MLRRIAFGLALLAAFAGPMAAVWWWTIRDDGGDGLAEVGLTTLEPGPDVTTTPSGTNETPAADAGPAPTTPQEAYRRMRVVVERAPTVLVSLLDPGGGVQQLAAIEHSASGPELTLVEAASGIAVRMALRGRELLAAGNDGWCTRRRIAAARATETTWRCSGSRARRWPATRHCSGSARWARSRRAMCAAAAST